jgi:hypothetical protein
VEHLGQETVVVHHRERQDTIQWLSTGATAEDIALRIEFGKISERAPGYRTHLMGTRHVVSMHTSPRPLALE